MLVRSEVLVCGGHMSTRIVNYDQNCENFCSDGEWWCTI